VGQILLDSIVKMWRINVELSKKIEEDASVILWQEGFASHSGGLFKEKFAPGNMLEL